MADQKCDVCGSTSCPCPLCHGNPKKWLGGVHGGRQDPETGAVSCPECHRTSSSS